MKCLFLSKYQYLHFLIKDKEELRSLENEISDRFFNKYDVEIEKSELDNKRAELIRKYNFKSNKLLKKS